MSFSRVQPGEKPFAVGHRGYMEKYPENSEISLDEALRVGSNGLETDVHMSQDGVVVLCHDAVLKRLYGVDATVTSLPWEGGLDQLRTVREPHSPMMTFRQLCHKLASSDTANGTATSISENTPPTKWSDTWILIDIKIDNPLEILIPMRKDLEAVNPDMSFWAQRMMFGIYHTDFLPACATHIPELPLAHIGLSLTYAIDNFLPWPQVKSFNMFLPSLFDVRAKKFIRIAHQHDKSVMVWTVNSEPWMKWAIYLKTDAVLTNDPPKYIALRDHVPSEKDSPENWSLRDRLKLYLFSWLGYIFMSIRVWHYSKRPGWTERMGTVEERVVKGGIQEKIEEVDE